MLATLGLRVPAVAVGIVTAAPTRLPAAEGAATRLNLAIMKRVKVPGAAALGGGRMKHPRRSVVDVHARPGTHAPHVRSGGLAVAVAVARLASYDDLVPRKTATAPCTSISTLMRFLVRTPSSSARVSMALLKMPLRL